MFNQLLNLLKGTMSIYIYVCCVYLVVKKILYSKSALMLIGTVSSWAKPWFALLVLLERSFLMQTVGTPNYSLSHCFSIFLLPRVPYKVLLRGTLVDPVIQGYRKRWTGFETAIT